MSPTDNEAGKAYYLDGVLGIGTQEPKATLHISVPGGFGDLKLFSPKDPGADFAYDGGSDNIFYFDNYGADTGTTNFRHDNRDLLVIKNDGNVGVGTTTPKAKLHVTADIVAGSDVNGQRFIFHSRTNGGGDFLHITGDDVNGNWLWDRGLAFVRGTGNVGIGTANPSQRLHVAGGNGVVNNVFLGDVGHGQDWAGFSHASATSPTAYGFLQHSSGQYALINKKSGAGWMGFRVDNQDKMVMTDDGTLKLLADSNPLWVTAGWHGNPDNVTNVSEISNDVGGYKTLMIVGNRSAGMGRRVSVWDRLEVNGTFVNNSSITTKQDVQLLSEDDYRDIHEKLTQTPLYRYRFRADGINQKSRIGVISEESPVEILDETGKYVSLLDYLGFLFVAIKAQAKRIEELEGMVSSRAHT